MKFTAQLASVLLFFMGFAAQAYELAPEEHFGGIIESVAYADEHPLETVDFVNVQSYMGKWYEIARIPQKFDKKCIGNTTAEYKLTSKGFVNVVNSCDTAGGQREVANGMAKVVDQTTNAKLKVTFVKIFNRFFFKILGKNVSGDYWVVELAPDYSTSIVGHPSRKYGWILSRTPLLEGNGLGILEAKLRAKGYDTCQLITTPQAGGLQIRVPLCEAAKDI